MAQSTLSKIKYLTPTVGRYAAGKRLDIQGLRAVAVIAVIADHLAGYPTGGFVGVDVFFVISGFIITSTLLRQHDRDGKISFADFYRRRVKRILPVSTLVLILTVTAGFLLYRTSRASGILSDGVWSLFFAGNWRFAISGTDYWAADGTISPLQHYWSLGVEEQFYFVWPGVILMTLAAVARWAPRRIPARLALGGILVVAILASFLWAMTETANNASWAYFSTASRAWELGIGALIAVSAGAIERVPNSIRPILAWVGLCGIVFSAFTLTAASQIPAPGVALPVLSTALVIAAGTGGQQRYLWLLTNRVSGYLGDISYSLYLWHFPVIVLGAVLIGDEGPVFLFVAVTVTAVLSVLSFTLVENPIRNSGWMEPGDRHRRRTHKISDNAKYVGVGALVLAAVVVCTVALMPKPAILVSVPKVTPSAAPIADTGAEASTNQAQLTAAINASLALEGWPELEPSIDNVMTKGAPNEDRAGCSQTVISDPNSCNFPQNAATKTAVVLGDSTGITLLPTVREALGEEYSVRGLTLAACVPIDVNVNMDGADKKARCDAHNAEAVNYINATSPDIVFISTMYGYINNLASGAPFHLAGAEWKAGSESTVRKLAPSRAKVVFVGSPPLGKSLTDCATNVSSPADCVVRISNEFRVVANATTEAALATGAGFLDSRLWFCNSDDSCPSYVGNTPVKRDAVHTTRQYASSLVPVFKDQLVTMTTGSKVSG